MSLVLPPSQSSIKDFIGYFEPLVVHALNQFSYTSSILLQQRVLFLLVQLLHLKVRGILVLCEVFSYSNDYHRFGMNYWTATTPFLNPSTSLLV